MSPLNRSIAHCMLQLICCFHVSVTKECGGLHLARRRPGMGSRHGRYVHRGLELHTYATKTLLEVRSCAVHADSKWTMFWYWHKYTSHQRPLYSGKQYLSQSLLLSIVWLPPLSLFVSVAGSNQQVAQDRTLLDRGVIFPSPGNNKSARESSQAWCYVDCSSEPYDAA